MKSNTFFISLTGTAILIMLGMSTASAQPTTPPGLDDAPPCTDPAMMPIASNVPCAGIFAFEAGTSAAERADILEDAGARLRFNYENVNGAAAIVPNGTVMADLAADPRITAIIPDRPVYAGKKPDNPGGGKGKGGGGGNGGQATPDGVARIGAAPGVLPVTGSGVGIAIIDTGIDFAHADLNVSASCFTAFSSCQDDHSHGTHVGGIAAALDNSSDVVGVAPEATLYAVKVLNSSGSGSDSTVTAGLDWVAANANSVTPPIRVVNLSLGRTGSLNDNPVMRESARVLAEDLGISVIVSAGNNQNLEVSDNVMATYPEVMAIASTTASDGNNKCKRFSGFIAADTASVFTTDGAFDALTGIGVTISAPGASKEDINGGCFINSVGILSLNLGGGTTRKSGTSMSAPHVTGVVALMVEDAGGTLDPEVARATIMTSASRVGVAPLNSPTSSYSFDGEREGILSACGAVGAVCP